MSSGRRHWPCQVVHGSWLPWSANSAALCFHPRAKQLKLWGISPGTAQPSCSEGRVRGIPVLLGAPTSEVRGKGEHLPCSHPLEVQLMLVTHLRDIEG
mmetsp:Transcript_42208/g.97726  ORF Transcript_42208/g.97726 Transcript_42208/m.97726 type:complete len:98 (-) Transcript_42208:20-313(-)